MRGWEQVWPSAGEQPAAPAPDRPSAPPSPFEGGDDLPPLTAVERCDACGAQAFVRARLADGGELLFCGHHGHQHGPMLVALGARLRDDSHLLADRR